jgi:DNA-binding transcriptional MerR regulator
MPGKRYRIGDFARLGGVSIKALRFYDEIGLLRPAALDARTRYRYYDASQLQELSAIRALADLGASLGDIRVVLTRADAGHARRRLLSKLRADALRTLSAAHRSLRWIDLELEESGGDIAPTVVLKDRAEIRIASIRATLRAYDDIESVERDLTRAVRPAGTGDIRGVLWHRCEASGVIEGEPFVELTGRGTRGAGYELKQLPGARVASAYCESDDAAAVRTYDAIDRWIHRRSLRLDGPKREICIGGILEIQFPVQSA